MELKDFEIPLRVRVSIVEEGLKFDVGERVIGVSIVTHQSPIGIGQVGEVVATWDIWRWVKFPGQVGPETYNVHHLRAWIDETRTK